MNAITLSSPADGAECVPENPILQWEAILNVQSYTVQIAEDEPFDTIVYDNDAVVDNRDTADINAYGETLYWRVIAIPSSGDPDTSVVRFFTTRFQSPPPVTEDDLTCTELMFELEWTDVTNNYHLQVAKNESFSNIIINDALVDTNIYEITVNDYGTEFYWRVAGYFDDGCKTGFSEIRKFTTKKAPVDLLSPADMTSGVPLWTDGDTTIVTPEWENVTSDETPDYVFQVSTDETFASNILIEENLDTNFLDIDVPQIYNGTFYWRVGYTLDECFSEWSDVFSFTTEYQPVSLLHPMDQDTCVDYEFATFCWDSLVEAKAYRLQIASHPTFEDNGQDTLIYLDSASISDTCFTFELDLANTEMYWRVRAEDEENTGKWSETYMFRTTIAPPNGLLPENRAGGIDLMTTIAWEEIGNDDFRYHLQVAEVAEPFEVGIIDTMYHDTSAIDIELDKKFQEYKWRVRVMNSDTCWSPWSMIYTFTTNIEAPTLVAPEDEATKVEIPIVWFEWNAVEGATRYLLQISKDEDFENVLQEETNLIETRNIIVGFDYEPNTTYYWRAQAYNAEGSSDWSEIFEFTTWVYPPDLPTIISPKDKATEIPVDVTLEWEGSENTDYFMLEIFDDPLLQNKIVEENVTGNSYDLEALDNYNVYTWRLKAVNEASESEWTRNYTFRTINIPPTDQVELTSPLDEATDIPLAFKLDWEEIEYAVYYWLQVAEDESFNNILVEYTNLTNSERVVNTLQQNKTYYWRVRGWNLQGEAPWSEVYSFTTYLDVSVRDKFSDEIGLNIYPNPIRNEAVIEFKALQGGNGEVSVYDANGNLVKTIFKGYISAGSNEFSINVDNLSNGIYYYKVNIGGKSAGDNFAIVK
jgi:hypothetical protein